MGLLKESPEVQNNHHPRGNDGIHSSSKKTTEYQKVPVNEFGDIELESEDERRERQRSLKIVYFTVFVQCLGASIVITGLWPFLQKLDREANKEWLGGIVAANPLGQLIFSPLIGWWCNRVNSIGRPSVFSLALFIFSNAWYALLPVHRTNAKYYMFAARFLVGVSSGSITACRTFISQETLLKERTSAISHLSLCQSLGFILGPVVQVALTQLGEVGYRISGDVTLSMYTASGWLAALVGIVNLVLYLPKFFKESHIADREARIVGGKPGKNPPDWSKIPPDYVGILPVVAGFFVVFFCYSLLETLGTPVTIDQFGWSHAEAIRNVGIATSISSIISLACFFTIPTLCKRFGERLILIVLGMGPTVLGRFFFFPFGGPVAPMRIEGCLGYSGVELFNVTSKASCDLIGGADWTVTQHGCPPEQAWCFEISALNGIALSVGYGVCTIGYPYSVVLLQTIFSKMIGPRPQGVWMGALTGISSLARVVGPFFVTYIYTKYGTIATSATAAVITIVATSALLVVYKRLVPIKFSSSPPSS